LLLGKKFCKIIKYSFAFPTDVFSQSYHYRTVMEIYKEENLAYPEIPIIN
jgi:hypothetical protein